MDGYFHLTFDMWAENDIDPDLIEAIDGVEFGDDSDYYIPWSTYPDKDNNGIPDILDGLMPGGNGSGSTLPGSNEIIFE